MRYIDLQSIRFVTTIKRNVDANQTSFPLSVFASVRVQSYRLNEYIVLSVEQVNAWVLVQGFDILSRRGCKFILRHASWGLALSDLRKVRWIWDIYAVYGYITDHHICMIFSPQAQACVPATPPGPCGPRGCDASGPAHWPTGPSRNDLTSWA